MRKEIVIAIGILAVLPAFSIALSDAQPHGSFETAMLLKEKAHSMLTASMPQEYYKFYVAKGITMSIATRAAGDVDLYLYNPEKKGVAYSCTYTGNEEIMYTADETGYWYAKVITTDGNADYDITLNLMVKQHDCGYDGDAGNRIVKSLQLFPGEPADGTPGRDTHAMLYPPSDKDDWYTFSACTGQTIKITMTPEHDYDMELVNKNAETVATSSTAGNAAETIEYKADMTGSWFVHVYAVDETAGNYTLNIVLAGQNDAGSNKDAGNTADAALKISAGEYDGYMDYSDQVDWYAFDVNSGDTISLELDVPPQSDYDMWLYDPNGNLATQGTYYGDDKISYPADVGGTWKLKIDMFPGWSSKWDEYPVTYFKYGSGAYSLKLSFGGTGERMPVVPQPDITPVAQTFVVQNDPNSNKDEYAYIAAIPAANYVDNGKRYVSPVVYEGDDTITHWFGTVDDTTDYLLSDWNDYLSHFGKEAKVYNVDSDPVKAAADIATTAWKSSSEAVVVIDGSSTNDTVKEVLNKDATLNIVTKVTDVRGDDSKIKDFNGQKAYPLWIGKKWGAVRAQLLDVNGQNIDLSLIGPKYREVATDWWPYNEDREDMFYPVALPGPYAAAAATSGTNFRFHIQLISGDRYKIKVDDPDSTLSVTVTTDEATTLMVYLIDPYGNIRAPDMPSWSGAPIKPIHEWNGNKSNGDERTYSHLIVEPSTTRTAVVHHPMTGTWTAIVVPYEETSGSIKYNIKGEIRYYSKERMADGLSAANGAVIASLKHIPLLYVTKDGIPDETSSALSKLGVNKVIFVEMLGSDADGIASKLSSYNVERLSGLQQIIDYIKEIRTENYITITSFATGDGYFAPAAYLAAYHGSPVLRVGEMGDAYNLADIAHQFAFYLGDYYHGCRSIGHLSMASKPIMDYIKNGELPPMGLDEELRWLGGIAKAVREYIANVGLDMDGREMLAFVAPKTDIRFMLHHALIGNETSPGQIPGETPAEAAAYINRNVLYPAIIFASPGRNYTSSSLINFADGSNWGLNNGKTFYQYTSREYKKFASEHGRDYRGHCVWDNLLMEHNRGASVYYYSGHGTGGSGIGGHPVWGGIGEDGWRGYQYWQGKTPRTGGFTWYDVEPPRQYDIVHFKWADQLWENLHSEFVAWMSCTTGAHFGPLIYLEHGAVAWYGNANTGLSPAVETLDTFVFEKALHEGKPIGEAMSEVYWLIERDFTTMDPTSVYGSSSLSLDGDEILYGDPALIIYSPSDWHEPAPIDAQI